jgi:hypothetical protein
MGYNDLFSVHMSSIQHIRWCAGAMLVHSGPRLVSAFLLDKLSNTQVVSSARTVGLSPPPSPIATKCHANFLHNICLITHTHTHTHLFSGFSA